MVSIKYKDNGWRSHPTPIPEQRWNSPPVVDEVSPLKRPITRSRRLFDCSDRETGESFYLLYLSLEPLNKICERSIILLAGYSIALA